MKKTSNRFSPEVRERAVRMVLEHGGDHASQWAAIGSIASKIGCTGETLRKWVRQAERDQGQRRVLVQIALSGISGVSGAVDFIGLFRCSFR
jgi:transposase-like protein